jgi:hypothetical protein
MGRRAHVSLLTPRTDYARMRPLLHASHRRHSRHAEPHDLKTSESDRKIALAYLKLS